MIRELLRKGWKLIILLIAFAYFILPTDILPFNPIDDIIVLATALSLIGTDLKKIIKL